MTSKPPSDQFNAAVSWPACFRHQLPLYLGPCLCHCLCHCPCHCRCRCWSETKSSIGSWEAESSWTTTYQRCAIKCSKTHL